MTNTASVSYAAQVDRSNVTYAPPLPRSGHLWELADQSY